MTQDYQQKFTNIVTPSRAQTKQVRGASTPTMQPKQIKVTIKTVSYPKFGPWVAVFFLIPPREPTHEEHVMLGFQ